MSFWKSLLHQLQNGHSVILMYVTQSEGSSPGRQGFKMWVNDQGEMNGSIGGGIMEHKLVEWCKELLKADKFTPFLKHQIHQEDIAENKSGMICDGQQSIAFVYLTTDDASIFENVISHEDSFTLTVNNIGLSFDKQILIKSKYQWSYHSDENWEMKESLGFVDTIYIIGGGHVGLALSEIMNQLDFYVINLDNREMLNTMQKNDWAHEKIVVEYDTIDQFIPDDEEPFVALMSFGYRTDHQIIRKLFGKNYRYFGVMGSQVKMDKLFASLKEEGYRESDLQKIYTPIGLKIHSKTPMEIAISVAAQIISIKNST